MSAPLASVRVYSGGGFNMNNIAATVAVLEANSTANDLEVINCLPVSGKTNVTITVKPFANLTKIDYIRIVGSDGVAWYGIVNGYEYASMTSVYINATLDGWLTCQAAGIQKISGYLTRHSTADDEWFQYTEEDPLLTPSKPLVLDTPVSFFGGTGSRTRLIESTINLSEMGEDTYNTSRTFDSDGEVVVPLAVSSPASVVELVSMVGGTAHQTINGRGFYDATNAKVQKGVAVARSLGYENGILGSYLVPDHMISASADADGIVASISGQYNASQSVGKAFRYTNINVNNKRLFAGSANKYIMWSPASGEQITSNPEYLYEEGLSAPKIGFMSDPRSKGKPFFAFLSGPDSMNEGINKMISGLEWDNLPLNYSESSGQGLKERIFAAQQADKYEDFERQGQANIANALVGAGAVAVGAATGNPFLVTGGAERVAGAGINLLNRELFERPNFERERAIEKAQFQSSVYIAPQIVSPPNGNLMRDLFGNGVFVARYHYDNDDVRRLDKVLNMFGYKDNKVFEMSDLNVGVYCCYLECSDVTVVSNAPRFAEEIAAQQLSAGIRLWRQKPDSALYANANR